MGDICLLYPIRSILFCDSIFQPMSVDFGVKTLTVWDIIVCVFWALSFHYCFMLIHCHIAPCFYIVSSLFHCSPSSMYVPLGLWRLWSPCLSLGFHSAFLFCSALLDLESFRFFQISLSFEVFTLDLESFRIFQISLSFEVFLFPSVFQANVAGYRNLYRVGSFLLER